jgi:hypothetical protein
MKNLNKFLVLIFGLSTFTAIAQKADSVIVIYDNQRTVIPLPAFGSQTSVSYADTNKVVEIGVWLRKPGETSPFSQLYSNDLNSVKAKSKSKWFSEVEAGYLKGSTYGEGIYGSTYFTNEVPITMTEYYSVSERKGYQIRLSVLEGEYYLNNKFSLISGFKLGFAQSYLQAYSFVTLSDSSGNQLSSYDEDYKFRIYSFQFLYQIGISYHFNIGELPARINLGNSLGILSTNTRTNNQQTYGNYLFASGGGRLYASLLQPYFGMEIWKVGVLFSADLALPKSNYYILHSNLGGNISIALTYRIF